MSNQTVEELFGELRSAVAARDLLRIHHISAKINKSDKNYYHNVVIGYLSDVLDQEEQTMNRDRATRIESFKAWARAELDKKDKDIYLLFKLMISDDFFRIDLSCMIDYYTFNSLLEDLSRLHNAFEIPLSASFKKIEGEYSSSHVLDIDFQDALWMVLKEYDLLK